MILISLDELLFELSNDERLEILATLNDSKLNVTSISKKLGHRIQQTSRHLSRLGNVGLVEKNVDGNFMLTEYGRLIMSFVQVLDFISNHREYFSNRKVQEIPLNIISTIRSLAPSRLASNPNEFLGFIGKNIKKSSNYIHLQIDQYPYNAIDELISSSKRGVQIRILQTSNILGPEIAFPFNTNVSSSPVKLRKTSQDDTYLYVSDAGCAICFKVGSEHDYRGFISENQDSIDWCNSLFEYNWNANVSHLSNPPLKKIPSLAVDGDQNIVVDGTENPHIDVLNLQNAINNYEHVTLRGRFNLGDQMIHIKKSTIIMGDGRTDGIPDAKLYKKGWKFPFYAEDFLFKIRGKKIDVIIENLHFESFNGTCIFNQLSNSVKIKNNRITLPSGLGRGLSFGKLGDHVVGITCGGESKDRGNSIGGCIIEGNYLDFGTSPRDGYFSGLLREDDPEFRPNLLNHEAPVCVGIFLNRNLGKVIVRNNIVKNMNSRGILVADNWETSNIEIIGNKVSSKIYGAYPYNSSIAGVGIFVQGAWVEPRTGGRVYLDDNEISCSQVNYCGIAVHGPSTFLKGAGKLEKCTLYNNKIHLEDGLYGIQLRKTDDVEVVGNKLDGRVYYGLHISGKESKELPDLLSKNNVIKDNDFEMLNIKNPDYYSDDNANGYLFAGLYKESQTAHIWLNQLTKNNDVELNYQDTIIDHGNQNKITKKYLV